MKVVLQVVSGPSAGWRIQLRDGQSAQFGRTELADFSFPHDADMADIQFSLVCKRDCCELRDDHEQPTTRLNGEPVGNDRVLLASGDHVTAGSTQFHTVIEGMVVTEPSEVAEGDAGSPADGAAVDDLPPSGQELADYLELDDASCELANEQQSGDELLAALKEASLYAAAVRLQAHLLERREAVWWGHATVGKLAGAQLGPAEHRALDAAEHWVAEPNQSACHAAAAAAEEVGQDRAAAWIATAAFWSGETLGGDGQAQVMPDDRLTGKAITAAILTAVYQYASDKANDTFLECLGEAGTSELPLAPPAAS